MPNSHDVHEPDEARRSLAELGTRSLDRRGDRAVHGLACAGFGVLIGISVGVGRLARDSDLYEWIFLGGYLVVLLALGLWQSRATRTWPRSSRRTSMLGLGGSVLLSVVGNGWLNWEYRDDAGPLPLLLAASVVVALPLLAAGHLIARGGKR